ncbi:MAG TPA: glycosyltransferase family 9 protein [Thermoanaerobaculia bacterium]|jgi:heptosyltransferase-2|nr:glycosyltransferase family 9 protein [Thermoanaerobaculia bacterium]
MASAFAPALAAPPREPRSIFVLRNNDVGDLLVVTPLFEALRRRFPQAWIAAGVGSWNLDVLRHNPHLSEVLAVNAPWFNKYREAQGTLGRLAYLGRSPEVRELARRRFEVGIDVLGSAWGSLLLLRAGIPYRLGVRGYAGGHSAAQATVAFDPGLSVGRSALRFAELLGAADLPAYRPQIFLRAAEREAAERWWAEAETDGRRRRRVVVGPGGGLAAKRWPGESFAALAARLPKAGDVSLLVLGGPREGELVARVAAGAAEARILSPAPGLRETFALVAACDLVVCNSSMLLHAAAAFAKPSVVLLGEAFPSASQHQAQWGYPGLSRSLGQEPRERTALATPEEALAAVQEMLSSPLIS